MRKFLCAAGSVLSTLFSMIFAVLGTYMVFEKRGEPLDQLDWESLLVAAGAVLIGLLVVNLLNMVADKNEIPKVRIKGLRRWVMSSLLAVFLACVITAGLSTVGPGTRSLFSEKKLQYTRLLLIISCTAAVCLFAKNYDSMLPRRMRINSLVKKESLNGTRRFTLLTESLATDGIHIIVTGKVNGTIRKGDKAVVKYGEKCSPKVRILSIKVNNRKVHSVTDAVASLYITVTQDKREKYYLYKYSVLTGMMTIPENKGIQNTENPGLLAMISGFEKHHDDRVYLSLLNYELIHAKYFICGMLRENDMKVRTGDIMDPLLKNTNVQFPGVFVNGKQDRQLLALFTDWDSLRRWQSAMKDEKACALIADMPQVINMVNKGFQGAVINPFGPKSFFVSPELMNSLRNTRGYREDFLEKG